MELLPVSGIAAITALCGLLGEGVKVSPLDDRYIPVLCGVFGALLGAAGLWLMPGFPADDPITAAAVGAVSGLAATGFYEAVKQVKKL